MMFVQGLRRRGALLVTVSSYILDWVVLMYTLQILSDLHSLMIEILADKMLVFKNHRCNRRCFLTSQPTKTPI